MQEFADRPLRVPGEPWPLHLWRLARWVGNVRLVPPRRDWRGGPLGALRRARLSDLLTRPGQVLVWAAVMVALLGFRNRDAFPLLGAGAALALVAWSVAVGQALRPRVAVSRRLHGAATAGQLYRCEVTLRNLGRLPLYDYAVRELRVPGLRLVAETQRRLGRRLAAGASVTVPLEFTARRRGVCALDGVAVQSYFPFFLTRATTRCRAAAELVVLPPAPRVELPPLRSLAAQLAGAGAGALRRQIGIEYHESRPFQSGDSPLRLDHRASARRGTLMTRVHRGSDIYLPAGVALVCDTSLTGFAAWQRRPRDDARLDARLGLAVELARRAQAEQLGVHALWLGEHWQRPDGSPALWRALAACVPRRACDLPPAPPAPDLVCLLVLGRYDAAAGAWAEGVRAAGGVVLVFVVPERAGDVAALPAQRGYYAVPG